MKQRVTKYDRWTLALLLPLFVIWFFTGCEWLRYTILGLTFLYLFVIRIVVHNLINRDGK